MNKTIKAALVVDWLTEGFGGGERVIKAVHDMYPDAPIYTSQYRPKRTTWLGHADVKTGWLNILPVWSRKFTPFFRQWYFSRLDLAEYDLVISITGAEAKAVKTRESALHVSYMHAPTQYYWTLYDDYIQNPGFGWLNPIARFGLKLLIGPLRRADYKAAQRPNTVVTISTYEQAEIKKYYGRDSLLVSPNVDIKAIQSAASEEKKVQREGYIIYGRQVNWKRMDLAISAAIQTGDKLTVIGDGPEHQRLVNLASGNEAITFLPSYNGIAEIVPLIQASKAFIFPSLEPFGIAPVEALATGTPVIALQKGGSLDFIRDGENGIFFEEQTTQSLVAAIGRFNIHTFDEATIRKSVEAFSEEEFKKRLRAVIDNGITQG